MSSALLTGLLAFGFGAVCMLLGFYLIVKGVGDANSESSVKVIGVEIRASKVGPGVVFALFGLVIAIFGLSKFPGDAPARSEVPPVTGIENKAEPPVPQPADKGAATPDNAVVARPTSAAGPSEPVEEPAAPEPRTSDRAREAELLRRALNEMATGRCPEELFEPVVMAACNPQIGVMAGMIASAGAIQRVEYATSLGGQDVFRVQHATGGVLWQVALSSDGKIIFMLYRGPG